MLHDQITLMLGIGRQHLNPIFDQRFDHLIAAGSQAEFRAGIDPVYRLPSQFPFPSTHHLLHFIESGMVLCQRRRRSHTAHHND